MHAVGADERGAAHAGALLQLERDAVTVLREAGTAGAKVDGVGLLAAHCAREDLEQIGPVDGEIGKAVALDRCRAEIEELPGLAGIPQPDFLALRFARERFQLLAHTERVKNARPIRGELHARADFLELLRLLVDLDIEARAEQRERGGEAADAATGDEYAGHAGEYT